MGYAIVGGIGLFVGIGLMIWALRERSKRHEAERKADKAQQERADFERAVKHNAQVAVNAEAETKRVERELDGVRLQLSEVRKRLAQCGDPKAVKAWLDDELKEEDL